MKNLIGIMFVFLGVLCLNLHFAGAASEETVQLFDKNCKSCHGADGSGDTPVGKKLGIKPLKEKAAADDAGWTALLTKWTETIKNGVQREGETKKVMPAYAEKLNDEQVKAIVEYCKELASK